MNISNVYLLISQKHSMLLITQFFCLNFPSLITSLSHCIHNWLISFLTDRSQVVKCGEILSLSIHINSGIIQGSGVGPTLYIIIVIYVHFPVVISLVNMLLIPTSLFLVILILDYMTDEFYHIYNWAKAYKMIIIGPTFGLVVLGQDQGDCVQVLKCKVISYASTN